MKKTYIIPTVRCTAIHFSRMIATSIKYDQTTTTGTQYVKGDQSSSYRGGNHSVWDDDWSQ